MTDKIEDNGCSLLPVARPKLPTIVDMTVDVPEIIPSARQIQQLREVIEDGTYDEFVRLYQANHGILSLKDNEGRTAAHEAACKDRCDIIQFIKDQHGDLDVQDADGNTPLHMAIDYDAPDALKCLLNLSVNTGILNDQKQAPVHLATELNSVDALKIMGRFRDIINIEKGGEHRRTALHLAAILDHEECARILISEFGASLCQQCENGDNPIHEAAKNASSKTMEVFFQVCTREEMRLFNGAKGNVLLLDSAVRGGNIKTVEFCIESGVKISTQQDDLSTLVHMACAQGSIDIVKLMFTMQPDETKVCLTSVDAQQMTPLHCASMFDHSGIVEYLVQQGADINALNKERRPPLLLAASRGSWKAMHVIIRLGANIDIKDCNNRNVLHLLIMNGGCLEDFAQEVTKAHPSNYVLQQLLNEKDDTGCSPLHIASREGHIHSLKNLIRLGASINLKNKYHESPLHFAVRYGKYNTVRQLLDSEKGSFIINESDGERLTPLHIASQQGHTRVVQLLLKRGARIYRDDFGRNPLHLAAMSGYTQTIKLLHGVHSHLLDQVDKNENTPLHLASMTNQSNTITLLLTLSCELKHNKNKMSAIDFAIICNHEEAAIAMVTHNTRSTEVMNLRSDKHPSVVLALISSMPSVFKAVQDKCITEDTREMDSMQFSVIYDFHAYQKSQDEIKAMLRENPAWVIPKPLEVVNEMVKHGRVELLAHRLTQKYLQMKWDSYGKYYHIACLFIYCVFLGFVTLYSSLMMENIFEVQMPTVADPINSTETTAAAIVNNVQLTSALPANPSAACPLNSTVGFDTLLVPRVQHQMVNLTTQMYLYAISILTFVVVNTLHELIQAYQHKWHYLFEMNKNMTWLLYVSATIMVSPIFTGGHIRDMHYSAASVTVLLSWFNFLLFLQRFDKIGIYVVMFLEMLQTLIKVLVVFSILIIAFGLSFYILMSKQTNDQKVAFSSIPMSLIRTFSMMLGELDFVDTFAKPAYSDELKFSVPSLILLCLFVLVMPILLMNLLIGLATDDIESVRRNAQYKQLAMQVVLHTKLEHWMPKCILERGDKMELAEYPNNMDKEEDYIDLILRTLFCNPFTDNGSDITVDSQKDYLADELHKQMCRLKKIESTQEQQHQMLRLMMQKMEIKTKADDVDEGVPPLELKSPVV